MKIASLTCSNTEIVCALGRADWLVGVDNHSDHPADILSGLPRLGPDLGIDVEKLASLAPDLVLASLTVPGHEKVVEAVAAAVTDRTFVVVASDQNFGNTHAHTLHLTLVGFLGFLLVFEV